MPVSSAQQRSDKRSSAGAKGGSVAAKTGGDQRISPGGVRSQPKPTSGPNHEPPNKRSASAPPKRMVRSKLAPRFLLPKPDGKRAMTNDEQNKEKNRVEDIDPPSPTPSDTTQVGINAPMVATEGWYNPESVKQPVKDKRNKPII